MLVAVLKNILSLENIGLDTKVTFFQLSNAFEWSKYVQPIPVPAQGEETEAGTNCTVSG